MERALIRQEISKACKRLALTQQVVTMCELEATPRQEEFLYQVLSQELAYRERLRRERLLKRGLHSLYARRWTTMNGQPCAYRRPCRQRM